VTNTAGTRKQKLPVTHATKKREERKNDLVNAIETKVRISCLRFP